MTDSWNGLYEPSIECILLFNVILVFANVSSSILFVWAAYKFGTSTEEKKRDKYLYLASWPFLIVVWIWMILAIISAITSCDHFESSAAADLHMFSTRAGLISYFLSWTLCFGLLFGRLFVVFRGSAFALSKPVIALWCVTYGVFLVSAGVYGVIPTTAPRPVQDAAISVALLSGGIILIWVNGLFVYKLVCLYRLADDRKNDKFVDIMTKTTILALCSVFTGILIMVADRIALQMNRSAAGMFIVASAMTLDIVTTFMSVILPLHAFSSWYGKICCHGKTKDWIHKMVNKSTPSEQVDPSERTEFVVNGIKPADAEQAL